MSGGTAAGRGQLSFVCGVMGTVICISRSSLRTCMAEGLLWLHSIEQLLHEGTKTEGHTLPYIVRP
jgi:hypothetical protein